MRPYNTRMEPSRLTVLCDHVTEARGSFAALDGLKARWSHISNVRPKRVEVTFVCAKSGV